MTSVRGGSETIPERMLYFCCCPTVYEIPRKVQRKNPGFKKMSDEILRIFQAPGFRRVSEPEEAHADKNGSSRISKRENMKTEKYRRRAGQNRGKENQGKCRIRKTKKHR
jgi:hypothetical protein